MAKRRTKGEVRGNLHVQIEAKLHEQVNDFCYMRRLVKGGFVEDALRAHLKRERAIYEQASSAEVAREAAKGRTVAANNTPDAYEARRRAAIKQMTGEPLTQQDKDALRGQLPAAKPSPSDDGLDDLLRRREQESIALTAQHEAAMAGDDDEDDTDIAQRYL